MKNILTAAAAVTIAVGIAACGASPAKALSDPASTSATSQTSSEPELEDGSGPETPLSESTPGSVAVGATVEVDGWAVTVTKVTKNLSFKTIQAWNTFNDAAPKGEQYVLADVTATYNGEERTADVSYLIWKLSGGDGVVYATASLVTPSDNLNWPTEARKGGKVKDQVVFSVPAAAVTGGAISVGGMMSEVYADFRI